MGGMSAKDFQDSETVFQIGVPPSRIDILQTIEAIGFASAWEASEPGMIGDDLPVRYISFDHLVANKLAVGRLRDLADVEALREARAASLRDKEDKG